MSQDVSMFLVTDDKEIVSVKEFDYDDADAIRFIMLTNELINHEYGSDNTIFIARDWHRFTGTEFIQQQTLDMVDCVYERRVNFPQRESEFDVEYCKLIWQADNGRIPNIHEFDDIDDALTDFNGYHNTIEILSYSQTMLARHNDNKRYQTLIDGGLTTMDEMFPAVKGAYNARIQFGGETLHGYLPSIGQMMVISDHVSELNDILSMRQMRRTYRLPMCFGRHDTMLGGCWWSSTLSRFQASQIPTKNIKSSVTLQLVIVLESGYNANSNKCRIKDDMGLGGCLIFPLFNVHI